MTSPATAFRRRWEGWCETATLLRIDPVRLRDVLLLPVYLLLMGVIGVGGLYVIYWLIWQVGAWLLG